MLPGLATSRTGNVTLPGEGASEEGKSGGCLFFELLAHNFGQFTLGRGGACLKIGQLPVEPGSLIRVSDCN